MSFGHRKSSVHQQMPLRYLISDYSKEGEVCHPYNVVVKKERGSYLGAMRQPRRAGVSPDTYARLEILTRLRYKPVNDRITQVNTTSSQATL
jgi:hypothetical protein